MPVKEGLDGFPVRRPVYQGGTAGHRPERGKLKKDIAYYITSKPAGETDAETLPKNIRGQWSIENSLHWVRDVTLNEDQSQIRTGSAPCVIASIRNLAISLLRLRGFKNIASGLRKLGWNAELALSLIGI
ncbi:ISAs1 family transposase [Desulfofundulus thermocisternus]|uniref:ISAs1 family transposase n=1 Tax=Desulfofundulus thermocisternus TaxID=42471 RepID=UPI0035C6B7EC